MEDDILTTETEITPDGSISGNDVITDTPAPDAGTEQKPEQTPEPPAQDNVQDEVQNGNDSQQKEVYVEVQQAFDSGELGQILSDTLTETLAGLEEQDSTEELADRLDEVILLLTPEETEEEPAVHAQLSIPSADYTAWDYPVRATYGITTSSGYSTYVGKDLDSSGAFEADFEKMQDDVDAGYLQSFYIRYVYGAGEDGSYSQLLYDSENPVTAPEEPEENPVADLLLSHLENINTYLSDMAAADTEYHQATLEYREEMLKLQTADTASTVILCLAVFILVAQTMFVELFRRFK